MMKAYPSKAEFIRSLGIPCTNAQGQYSFVDHNKKRVYFSLDIENNNPSLILGDTWAFQSKITKNGVRAKNPTYSKSIPHIKLITDAQYELYIFRTQTRRDDNGKTHATNEFDPNVERRILLRKEDGWHALADSDHDTLLPPEVSQTYIDGAQQLAIATYYERDPSARSACLAHYGFKCKICDFDFEDTFGEHGKGFIHVHHITPLHTVKKEHLIDPIKDLLPVCPNCHAMLHARGKVMTPAELKMLIKP